MSRRRQGGALLLMVSLLLATLAALAFGMNRAGSAELRAINDDYEGRAADYLAQAGVAAARWSSQVGGCNRANIPRTTLGAGAFTASVSGSDKLAISVTATVNGASRTLARTGVVVYDLTDLSSTDVSDDALDTTIAPLSILPENERPTLNLFSGTAHALLYWKLDEVGHDELVVSAILTLTQEGAGIARRVAVHRVTTAWDKNASWYRPRGAGSWNNGGDYSSVVLASTSVAAGNASWDLTGIVDAWVSERLLNQGLLLRLEDPLQSVSFYSQEASSSRRPVLRVITAEEC